MATSHTVDNYNTTTTTRTPSTRRSDRLASKQFWSSKSKKNAGGNFSKKRRQESDESDGGGDDVQVLDLLKYHRLESVVKNLPEGIEVDFCPVGSIRQERINQLADAIEFATSDKHADESDSDISLTLDDLEDTHRFATKFQSGKSYLKRRCFKEKEKMGVIDNSKIWTNKVSTVHKSLPSTKKEERIKYINTKVHPKYQRGENTIVPIIQEFGTVLKNDVHDSNETEVIEIENVPEKRISRIQVDTLFDFPTQMTNTMKKLSAK